MEPRPAWPYALGAIGAVLFALGAAALLYSYNSPSESSSKIVLAGLGLGGTLLGVGWLGVFKQKQCGFGVIGSSFAIPLAFLYVYLHRNDWEMFDAGGMLVLLVLALFALAHLFVRSGWVRAFAGLASLGLWIEIIATTGKMSMSADTHKSLAYLGTASLAALGLAIAGALYVFHRAPPPQADEL